MNREPARRTADKLYSRMIQNVIKALGPFLGLPISPALNKDIAKATRPIVVSARSSLQNLAYQDYLSVIENEDPIPKMSQNRFTEGLWDGVIEAATKEQEHLNVSTVEEIGMQADRWTRDAEWGQRFDSAKRDERIGRVARVDFKPPTCPWCTLLNSRGAVYTDTETAAATLHNGDTCTLVFVPRGSDTYPGKEHSEEALRRYTAAREAVGGKPEDILKELAKTESSGSVRKDAKQAAAKAAQAELKAVQARISTLEKLNPKSESAIKYRNDQLTRNRGQLENLTRSLNS